MNKKRTAFEQYCFLNIIGDMEDYLQKAPFKNLQKGVKMTSKIPLLVWQEWHLHASTFILSSWENGSSQYHYKELLNTIKEGNGVSLGTSWEERGIEKMPFEAEKEGDND